ncbi:MAG TPA: peptidase MA family metallohydrolase, partial [Thermomicrobiales bacterium]|nr:peptidase MA family metallohydrolase [Thermomicrobiales bacterium]
MNLLPTAVRRVLILFLVGLVALTSVPLATTVHRAAAASEVAVNNNEATTDFPDGVNFTLDVEGARKITRIELLYQAADLETLNLEVPEFKPRKHVTLSHHLDFRVNFEPSGIDITYRWRLTDDKGNTTETEPKTLLWSDNRFDWRSQSSHDVTVYGYRNNDAFDKLILDSAQSTVDRLKVEYGVESVTPIRIWVYNSKKDFSAAQQGNSSEWIAGTAYPQLHVILAILPEGNKGEVGRVIPHEISHQLLYQATMNPFNGPPTWLDEGLAVLVQDGGNEGFPAQVEDAAEKGRLFSVRALNSSFPYDPADAALAYAESLSIVRFIIDHFGEDKLAAVIAAYRDGVSHDEALMKGLSVDIDGLDRLWKESLDYPGDQPRGTGTTGHDSRWTDFYGTGLASGVLVILIALLAVSLFGLTTGRRTRRP